MDVFLTQQWARFKLVSCTQGIGACNSNMTTAEGHKALQKPLLFYYKTYSARVCYSFSKSKTANVKASILLQEREYMKHRYSQLIKLTCSLLTQSSNIIIVVKTMPLVPCSMTVRCGICIPCWKYRKLVSLMNKLKNLKGRSSLRIL